MNDRPTGTLYCTYVLTAFALILFLCSAVLPATRSGSTEAQLLGFALTKGNAITVCLGHSRGLLLLVLRRFS